jgi:S-(hydroxymethyl)glutathione synthase
MWAMVGHIAPADYAALNEALKARAEAAERQTIAIHPAVDGGELNAAPAPVERLRCECAQDPVEIKITAPMKHPHLCGCSQCWKPDGAVFALIAVVPHDAAAVVACEHKLHIVAPDAAIQRHACRDCGAHMIGKVSDPDHHFYGLAFIHPELSGAAPKPEFAGFVSSIIEAGASPTQMRAVRKTLQAKGIPAYDAFSPELMDVIAWHKVKMKKHAAR